MSLKNTVNNKCKTTDFCKIRAVSCVKSSGEKNCQIPMYTLTASVPYGNIYCIYTM